MPIARELKEKWIKALQSGDYTPTTGLLWRGIRGSWNGRKNMCCLGVLADITNSWDADEPGRVKGNSSAPPTGFCGLTAHEITDLAQWNDHFGDYPVHKIRDLEEI